MCNVMLHEITYLKVCVGSLVGTYIKKVTLPYFFRRRSGGMLNSFVCSAGDGIFMHIYVYTYLTTLRLSFNLFYCRRRVDLKIRRSCF